MENPNRTGQIINIEVPEGYNNPNYFILSKEEVQSLNKFFLTIGYINHDEHEPVHAIIKRLMEYESQLRRSEV